MYRKIFVVILLIASFFIGRSEVKTEYKTIEIIKYETEYVELPMPKNKIHASSTERELISRLLWTEARGENDECQRAIVSIIFNRLESGNWGSTIHNVIYAQGQFDFSGSLYEITPTEKEYLNVDFVIENGTTIPGWVQYFRAKHHFRWNNYSKYKQIDNTYFGGFYEK